MLSNKKKRRIECLVLAFLVFVCHYLSCNSVLPFFRLLFYSVFPEKKKSHNWESASVCLSVGLFLHLGRQLHQRESCSAWPCCRRHGDWRVSSADSGAQLEDWGASRRSAPPVTPAICCHLLIKYALALPRNLLPVDITLSLSMGTCPRGRQHLSCRHTQARTHTHTHTHMPTHLHSVIER